MIDNITQSKCFDYPCFGSKFLKDAIMLDNFLSKADTKTIRKIKNQTDLLKLSFFDIWVSNEDRNHNNYNIVINPETDGYYFYAIDNESIFNNGFWKKIIWSYKNDNLLFTDVVTKIFKNKKNKPEILSGLITDFDKNIENCKLNLNSILDNIQMNGA